MHDVAPLLATADRLRADGTPFALVTVLPPAPAARFVVPAADPDGGPDGDPLADLAGALADAHGDAHGDVLGRVRAVLGGAPPARVALGDASAFVEPVPRPGHLDPLDLLRSAHARALPAVLATVVDAEGRLTDSVGRRHLHFEDDTWTSDMRLHGLEEDVVIAARDALAARRSALRAHTFEDGAAHVAYEYLAPAAS